MSRWPVAVAAAVALAITDALAGSPAPGSAPTAEGATERCVPRWRLVVDVRRPLSDVEAVSPTNVWAVGTLHLGPVASRGPVIVHWNGRTLRTFRGFPRDVTFSAVSAAGPRDVWAVGQQGWPRTMAAVAMHWDGRSWRRMRLPRLAANASLSDVVALSRTEAWAVGNEAGLEGSPRSLPLVLRWDGRRWRRLNLGRAARRGSALDAVDGTGSRGVWVVGTTYDPISSHGNEELILRWNGRAWTRMASPYAHESQSPHAVDVSKHGVWTLHGYWGGAITQRALAWVGVDTGVEFERDYPDWDSLHDIVSVSPNSTWIVGRADTDRPPHWHRPLAAQWNGRSWRIQRLELGRSVRGLTRVSALSATDIWAVADRYLVRYSC